jgi:hypothetical protein
VDRVLVGVDGVQARARARVPNLHLIVSGWVDERECFDYETSMITYYDLCGGCCSARISVSLTR